MTSGKRTWINSRFSLDIASNLTEFDSSLRQKVDFGDKGWIDRNEFAQFTKNLEIPLKDATMDLDAIFGSLRIFSFYFHIN